MIYIDMINEGFFSNIKNIISLERQINDQLAYLEYNHDMISKDKLDKVKKLIDQFKDLSKSGTHKSMYDKFIDRYNKLTKYVDINNKKEAESRKKEEAGKPKLVFKTKAPFEKMNGDEDQNDLVKFLNSKVIPYVLSAENKKIIRQVIDNGFESGSLSTDKDKDGDFYNNGKIPTFKAKNFEPGIIEIIPVYTTTQSMNTLLNFVLAEIASWINWYASGYGLGAIYDHEF